MKIISLILNNSFAIGIFSSLAAAIIFALFAKLLNFILVKNTIINKCININYYINKLSYKDFLIDPKNYNNYFKKWGLTELLENSLLKDEKLIILTGRSRTGKTRAVLETLKTIDHKSKLFRSLENYLFISPSLELLKNPEYRKFIPRNFLFFKRNFIIFLDNALSLKFSGGNISEFLSDFYGKYNDVIVIMTHSKDEILNTNIDLNFFLEDYRKKIKINKNKEINNYLKEIIIEVPKMNLELIEEINENLGNNKKDLKYLVNNYDGTVQPLFYPESINYKNFNLLDEETKKIMYSAKLIFYSGFYPFNKNMLFEIYTSSIFNGNDTSFENSLKSLTDLQFINIISNQNDYLIIDPGILSRALRDYPYNNVFRNNDIFKLFDICFKLKDIERMMHITNKFFFSGQINESIECLGKVLEIEKDNKNLWLFLGAQSGLINKNEEAIKAFNEVIRIDGKSKEAWELLSDQLVRIGKVGESNKAIKKAILLGSEDPIVWYNYGNALCNESKFEEAEKAYKKAISLDKNDKKTWFNYGNSLKWQNKYSEAEKAYKKALEFDNQYANALINLSQVLEFQKKFDEAISTIKRIPKSDWQHGLAEWNLEGIKERKKNYQRELERERELLGNIERFKLNKDFWFELIIYYIERIMYEQAEVWAKRAIKVFKNVDGFYNLLGVSLFLQQKYKESDIAFKKSKIMGYDCYLTYGCTLLELKKYKESYKILLKALILNKTGKEVWNNIGLVFFEQKKFKKAIKAYLKATEECCEFILPHISLGTCYYKMKDFENAEKEFKKAITIDDKSIISYSNLGELYFELKKYNDAEILFKKIFGFIKETDKNLIKCLEIQGKQEEANNFKNKMKSIIYKNPKFLY